MATRRQVQRRSSSCPSGRRPPARRRPRRSAARPRGWAACPGCAPSVMPTRYSTRNSGGISFRCSRTCAPQAARTGRYAPGQSPTRKRRVPHPKGGNRPGRSQQVVRYGGGIGRRPLVERQHDQRRLEAAPHGAAHGRDAGRRRTRQRAVSVAARETPRPASGRRRRSGARRRRADRTPSLATRNRAARSLEATREPPTTTARRHCRCHSRLSPAPAGSTFPSPEATPLTPPRSLRGRASRIPPCATARRAPDR